IDGERRLNLLHELRRTTRRHRHRLPELPATHPDIYDTAADQQLPDSVDRRDALLLSSCRSRWSRLRGAGEYESRSGRYRRRKAVGEKREDVDVDRIRRRRAAVRRIFSFRIYRCATPTPLDRWPRSLSPPAC